MESKTRLLGHPIHPMVVPFPLGLLGIAVVFDPIASVGGEWTALARAASSMSAAGTVIVLLRVPPGSRVLVPVSSRPREVSRG
jgi:uncharacterized membrane protein